VTVLLVFKSHNYKSSPTVEPKKRIHGEMHGKIITVGKITGNPWFVHQKRQASL
jgi:hypothetical protein